MKCEMPISDYCCFTNKKTRGKTFILYQHWCVTAMAVWQTKQDRAGARAVEHQMPAEREPCSVTTSQ